MTRRDLKLPAGTRMNTVYLRVPADLVGRLKAIADRPPGGGRPVSINMLCNRLLSRFVKQVEAGVVAGEDTTQS